MKWSVAANCLFWQILKQIQSKNTTFSSPLISMIRNQPEPNSWSGSDWFLWELLGKCSSHSRYTETSTSGDGTYYSTTSSSFVSFSSLPLLPPFSCSCSCKIHCHEMSWSSHRKQPAGAAWQGTELAGSSLLRKEMQLENCLLIEFNLPQNSTAFKKQIQLTVKILKELYATKRKRFLFTAISFSSMHK